MKFDIIQFIKKIKFCRRLAAYDSLFAVKNFETFKTEAALCRPWVKKSSRLPAERMAAYLHAETNPIAKVFWEEFLLKYAAAYLYSESVEYSGILPVINNHRAQERRFYTKLARELIQKDNPLWENRLNSFNRRCDNLSDLRFYASEIEGLQDAVAGFDSLLPFQINWLKTGRDYLWIEFSDNTHYSAVIPVAAQRNLLRLWADLFFEKGIMVSGFPAVLYNDNNQVNFLEFGTLFSADNDSRNFLKLYFETGVDPKSHFEEIIASTVERLKLICPHTDIRAFFEGFASLYTEDMLPSPQMVDDGLLEIYQNQGLVMTTLSKLDEPEPHKLAYLLDKNRFKKDPQFRKSSAFYYVPLLIIIYLLFKYF